MSSPPIAILIDGAFFLKRLPKLVPANRCDSVGKIVACLRHLCRNHVKILTGDEDSRWHGHVYRIFYYDAVPYDGKAHHPIDNRPIDFAKSHLARQRYELFDLLRKQRKVALRLGRVTKEGGWSIDAQHTKKLLHTRRWLAALAELPETIPDAGLDLHLTSEQARDLVTLREQWGAVDSSTVRFGLRQKGVDMRIGIDIASLALKRQVETIVLVAGDSDFVPAAKLARREGMEIILDPLWQKVHSDLFEHIDGLQSGLKRPREK